jgi:hypothetical protein
MEHFLQFWCLEILPVYLRKDVKPFIIWFYPPLLYYNVSVDEVVELIVVIPTSLRSLKIESRCKVVTVFALQFLQGQISAKDFRVRLQVRGRPQTE